MSFSHRSVLLLLPLLLPACSDGEDPAPLLDPDLEWHGDNAAELEAMITELGVLGDSHDPARPPIAVFDWDNTVIKNDIGDMTVFYMLNNNLVLQPPDRDWTRVTPLFTSTAVAGLNQACDAQAEPGQPLKTDQTDDASKGCADAILAAYYDAATVAGEDAFTSGETETLEPSYGLAVQLQAGHTPDEIRDIGEKARDFALAQAIGARQPVGTGEYNAYIRIYDQIRDLIAVMQDNGFDVWVVSASSQYIVEPFAEQVGIPADHVIGVRATLDDAGKAEYTFQGCGTSPDGNSEMITFRQGKRCWINKVIFGETDGDAQLADASPIAFAAGDSTTDLWMLRDAQALRLVINRNRTELMCYAYENADGNWLVNPMFIAPLGQKADGYACDEYDIPDQQDTVY